MPTELFGFSVEEEVSHLDDYPFDIMDIANILRLTVRRELHDSVYVDCPFCQKRKGKMNLKLSDNVWRCNRCGKGGHMFQLYAELRGLTVSDAKLELTDVLGGGIILEERPLTSPVEVQANWENKKSVEQSPLATPEEIDRTMRAMLNMLSVTPAHREHLHSKRGLTDEQIALLGLKSTPSYKLRHTIPRRLMDGGYSIAGVPGFFVDKSGKWTANFTSWTAGILVPVRDINGLIRGAQIRLDHPIKDDDDDPEDEGTKYIWFSSSTKHLGASSGSPVNFIGDRYARTVYVTEGNLKAGISHCLTNRTFLSIQGANNLRGLEEAFQQFNESGTKLIIEALDMDKFSNECVALGAQNIYFLAKKYGMSCQSLTWNPNYKGFDDWQIALRRKAEKNKERIRMNFKDLFLKGCCDMTQIRRFTMAWENGAGCGATLQEYLGLNNEEYLAYQAGEAELQSLLASQRQIQQFRIYQLDFSAGQIIPFAFKGLKALYKAEYKQPPASEYRLAHDGQLAVPAGQEEEKTLKQIFDRYNDDLPKDYQGRSVAPSDVVELYDGNGRRYYFRDDDGSFVVVRFSPALIKSKVGAAAGGWR